MNLWRKFPISLKFSINHGFRSRIKWDKKYLPLLSVYILSPLPWCISLPPSLLSFVPSFLLACFPSPQDWLGLWSKVELAIFLHITIAPINAFDVIEDTIYKNHGKGLEGRNRGPAISNKDSLSCFESWCLMRSTHIF